MNNDLRMLLVVKERTRRIEEAKLWQHKLKMMRELLDNRKDEQNV